MNRERYIQSRVARWAESALYFAAVGGVLLVSAWLVFGTWAVVWLALLGAFVVASAVRIPLSLILRAQGARVVGQLEAPRLHALVGELSRRAGLARVPELYFVPSAEPQAFAVSAGDRSAVTVSGGLLGLMGPRELAGVLAHEISHLRNGDTRILMAARWMAQMTRSLATVGFIGAFIGWLLVPGGVIGAPDLLVLLIAPTMSALAFLALSRAREFDADASAAALTGDPRALGSALLKLDAYERSLWRLLLPIPVPDQAIPEAYRSHPSTRARVARLMELAPRRPTRLASLPNPYGPAPGKWTEPRRWLRDDVMSR